MARFFTPEEVAGLNPELVEALDRARGFAKQPFIITSGLRDPAHNAEAGGVSNSTHCKGLAVDLRCEGSRSRFRMVSALILAGFRRIGVYDRHLHVDLGPEGDYPQDVMWTGVSH
jgi:zinc D-Ala-D-Ala carboxypeptidase